MPTAQKLLTTIEMAELIGVHKQTLFRWRKTGDGPAWVKVGGVYRYYADQPELVAP